MARTGRPRLDDAGTLRKVAATLAEGRAGKVRSAILQSLDEPNDSNVRRLQRKWREVGEVLLSAARETLRRQREEDDRRARGGIGSSYYGVGSYYGDGLRDRTATGAAELAARFAVDLEREVASRRYLNSAVTGFDERVVRYEVESAADRLRDRYRGLDAAGTCVAVARRVVEETVLRRESVVGALAGYGTLDGGATARLATARAADLVDSVASRHALGERASTVQSLTERSVSDPWRYRG